MAKWWTSRNRDMAKFQNAMVLFSCLQLILSHPFINKIYGSEDGCPCHFMLHFWPSHPFKMYVPILLPLLNIHIFPHIRLKLHPSLCLLISPSYYPHSLPLRLPPSCNLHPPLHLYPYLCICLPLPRDVLPPLHINLYLLSFPLPHSFPLHNHLTHVIRPPLHLRLLHILFPLPIFIPLPLHSSYLHISHYHLHLNHRRKIIHCIAALMPLFYVYLLWNCVIIVKRWNGEMVKWIGTDIWWNKYGEMVQRIHTHVHMVKWLYGEMDWYRVMVKQVWWNGA